MSSDRVTIRSRRGEHDVARDDPRLYITGTGQALYPTHHENPECATYGCVIHHPTDPHQDWPTHWRGERGIMERICPHGVGHPDKDDLAFRQRMADARGEPLRHLGVHGCCGCCLSPEDDHALRD